MLGFFIELIGFFFGKLLHTKLPDCGKILSDFHSGVRKRPESTGIYVLLCRVTGLATVIRGLTIAVALLSVLVIVKHFNIQKFEVDFEEGGTHKYYYWTLAWKPPKAAAAEANILPITQETFATYFEHISVCRDVAYSSITFLGTGVVFFWFLAWLAQVLIAEERPVK